MTKIAPEWVRTSDPVIRSPARYCWTTSPARIGDGGIGGGRDRGRDGYVEGVIGECRYRWWEG